MRLRPRIFENHKIKFGFSPQNGKADLCTTNSSKVLIYLTLLYFLLHYLQEYSKILISGPLSTTVQYRGCSNKLNDVAVSAKVLNHSRTKKQKCHKQSHFIFYKSWSELSLLKPLQNKKGQKNLGYPREKQSFYKEKGCFFLGYPKFFCPFLFWSGFNTMNNIHICAGIKLQFQKIKAYKTKL